MQSTFFLFFLFFQFGAAYGGDDNLKEVVENINVQMHEIQKSTSPLNSIKCINSDLSENFSCDSPYDFKATLDKPSCNSKGNVIIFSERQHYSLLAEGARLHMRSNISNLNLKLFLEGLPESISGTTYQGIEKKELKALSNILAALPVVQDSLVYKQTDIFKSYLIIAQKLIKEGFTLWPDILVQMRDELLSKKSSQDDVEFYNSLLNENDNKAINTLLEDPLVTSAILSKWVSIARIKIKDVKGLEYLGSGKEENMMGIGRSIYFTKNILNDYCNSSKSNTVMVLFIGAGHVKETKCMLENYLPKNANIKIIDVESYYKDWYPNIQKTNNWLGFLKKIDDLDVVLDKDQGGVSKGFLPYRASLIFKNKGDNEKITLDKINKIEDYLRHYGFLIEGSSSYNRIDISLDVTSDLNFL